MIVHITYFLLCSYLSLEQVAKLDMKIKKNISPTRTAVCITATENKLTSSRFAASAMSSKETEQAPKHMRDSGRNSWIATEHDTFVRGKSIRSFCKKHKPKRAIGERKWNERGTEGVLRAAVDADGGARHGHVVDGDGGGGAGGSLVVHANRNQELKVQLQPVQNTYTKSYMSHHQDELEHHTNTTDQ